MIHIIYMAAGNSRRFGSNKLFYELNGKPMYRHLLERLIEIKDRYNKLKNVESNNPVIDITVVTRYREILDYCSSIPDCHAVLSPDSEKGISYTIKAGIMAVQEQKKTGMQDYYMFAVADQPYLKSQSVIKLIDKVLENKGNKRLVFSLRCGDAVGNPLADEGPEKRGLSPVTENLNPHIPVVWIHQGPADLLVEGGTGLPKGLGEEQLSVRDKGGRAELNRRGGWNRELGY